MIEIRSNETTPGFSSNHLMLVDGLPLDRQAVYVYGGGSRPFDATVRDRSVMPIIGNQTLNDIPKNLGRLVIDLDPVQRESDLRLRFQFVRENGDGDIVPRFTFVFRVHFWKRPWSMNELKETIRSQIEENSDQHIKWDRDRMPSALPNFSLLLEGIATDDTIADILADNEPRVRKLLTDAEHQLASHLKSDSLIAMFDFPAAVRAPCEQYLLYFVEFLRDLGVEAEANLQHDAGRVLFSISPRSGKEALDKIREALHA